MESQVSQKNYCVYDNPLLTEWKFEVVGRILRSDYINLNIYPPLISLSLYYNHMQNPIIKCLSISAETAISNFLS